MKRIFLTTLPALAFTPALAGGTGEVAPDPVIVPPPPVAAAPAAPDWTGFYGGAQLGWGMLDASGGASAEGNGVIGGVHAGYDWDFGDVVFGVGLDYNAANIDLDGGAGELDGLGRARLRAGYDAGRWLLYGTGGAAYGMASLAAAPGAESDIGWFAGAGAEYRVNEYVSVAGEALYHRFDDFDGSGVDLGATTLQTRLTYRF